MTLTLREALVLLQKLRVGIWTLLLGLSAVAVAEEVSPARLQQLQQQAAKLAVDLNAQRDNRSQTERRLAENDRLIANNQREIERLLTEQNTLTQRISRLQQEQQQLKGRLAEQEDEINALLVSIYQQSGQPRLKLLLSQEGPETLARALVYFEYFNEQQRAQLGQYATDIARLAQAEQQSNQSRLALVEQRAELDRVTARLSSQQQQRRQLLADLERDIQANERRLSGLQADASRLTGLLEQMAAAAAAASRAPQQSFGDTQGNMTWPTQGRLLQTFGRPVDGNALIRSEGVLIGAQTGQSVQVVHAGRVIFADYLRGYGMLVIVDHAEGWMSLYGRNDALLVDVGQWVDAGQQIARVGRTGGFAEPGLYFEVRQNNRPVDPASWLARR